MRLVGLLLLLLCAVAYGAADSAADRPADPASDPPSALPALLLGETDSTTEDDAYTIPLDAAADEIEAWGAPLIGPVLQIVAIVAGVLAVVWQIGKQFRNTLQAQREKDRAELKLSIYEMLNAKITKAICACVEPVSFGRMAAFALKNHLDQEHLGMQPQLPEYRVSTFNELNTAMAESVIELIDVFEGYKIVEPNLDLFQLAFHSALYDAREAFSPLYSKLLAMLPMDIEGPDGDTVTVWPEEPPSRQDLEELDGLVESYIKQGSDQIADYISDLRIEMQRSLLGDLFAGNEVRTREPRDPNNVVISLEADRVQELTDHFKNETPWGKHAP